MGPVAIGVIIGIIVLVLVIVVLNIKIVPQSKAYVIERLGAYSTTWQTGIHFKIPFIEIEDRLPQGAGRGFPAPARYHKG